MNNDTTPDHPRLSIVTVVLSLVAGIGTCGVLIFLLVWTGVTGLIPKDLNKLITQATKEFPTAAPSGSSQDVNVLNALLDKGNSLMKQGEYKQAIPVWTELIARMPSTAEVYHQRAICYYKLLPQEHDQEQAATYLSKALADVDQAVALQPTLGDYYAFRHDVLLEFTTLEEIRVNRQALIRIAHENVDTAIALGTNNRYPTTDRAHAVDLLTLEQCDQGLTEIEQILASTPPENPSLPKLYWIRAEARACLGRYDEAVKDMDIALQDSSYVVSKTYLKAVYLYQLGDLEEALALLDESLDSKPDFQGYRYYLRALIHYDLGEKDLANMDLETGSHYTWGRLGLRAYVLGKMALEAGQLEEGIKLLQMAEVSLDSDHMLIRSKIQNELAGLGEEPLSIPPSISIRSTPIPVHTVQP